MVAKADRSTNFIAGVTALSVCTYSRNHIAVSEVAQLEETDIVSEQMDQRANVL